MSCYDNILSVDGSCTYPSASSIYDLNQVDIDVSFLDSIVGRDFQTGRNLATNKLSLAVDIVRNEITNHFQNNILMTNILDNKRIGYPEINLQTKTGDGTRKGIEVELLSNTSYVDLYISSIDVQLATADTFNIEVWDLMQGKKLDDISVTSVANNIVTVQTDLRYESDSRRLHLAFLYDSTERDSIYTTTSRNCGRCTSLKKLNKVNNFIWTRGISTSASSDITENNLSGAQHTGGLSLKYSVQCNHLSWMCAIRNKMALPLLYKTAELIFSYALRSNRNNKDTLLDREELRMAKEDMEIKYNDAIKNTLGGITLPSYDKCFRCRPTSRTRISVP